MDNHQGTNLARTACDKRKSREDNVKPMDPHPLYQPPIVTDLPALNDRICVG